MGWYRHKQDVCVVWYFIKFHWLKAAQNETHYSIHNSFLTTGPLWRLWKYKLTTVISEARRNTRTHTLCWFMPGQKINWKADAIIDLSDSAKLMTVFITMRYWFLSTLYKTYAQCWTCTVNHYTFWSHPSKLQGLDPMLQRLVLNLSKCQGKKQPAVVRDMKSQRGWGHSK